MATIYNIKIKTVSAFVAYDEEYITKILNKFFKEYKDDVTKLGFESTEIVVQKNPSNISITYDTK
jgi:hypothetical protein